MTDPSAEQGEQPDLLAQATAAQPIARSSRSSSSRHRRRRRRGPNWPLIIGIVVVVIVIAGAAVIVLAHKSNKSADLAANNVSISWTYHDLNGHSVTVVPTETIKFVDSQGSQIPKSVLEINKAVTKRDCTSLQYYALLAYKAGTPQFNAMAAYTVDQAKKIGCTWTSSSSWKNGKIKI